MWEVRHQHFYPLAQIDPSVYHFFDGLFDTRETVRLTDQKRRGCRSVLSCDVHVIHNRHFAMRQLDRYLAPLLGPWHLFCTLMRIRLPPDPFLIMDGPGSEVESC